MVAERGLIFQGSAHAPPLTSAVGWRGGGWLLVRNEFTDLQISNIGNLMNGLRLEVCCNVHQGR